MFARPEPINPRPRPSERPDPRPWLALYAASFTARALPLCFARAAALPDWLPIANNLAHGLGLAVNAAGGPTPTTQIPPLAPWLASGVVRMAGAHSLAPALGIALLGALVPLVVAS